MKNIFKYTIAGFAALAAVSCQRELAEPSVVGEETTVRFTVNAPAAMQAKAEDLPGTYVDILHVEIYTDEECSEMYEQISIEGKQTTWDLDVTVLKGKSYHMLLVAGCKGNFQPLEGNAFSSGIKFPFSGPEGEETLNANREEQDVFVAKTSFDAKTAGGSITLARPFAQVNIYADDFAGGDVAGLELVDQTITFKSSDEYDILSGKAGEVKTMTFKTDDSYDEDGRVLMCYVLPEDSKSCVMDMDITLNFTLGGTPQTITHNLTNVPVQTNHRTNISGNLYVENAEFTFSIGDFAGSSDVDVWDGVTTEPVVPDDENPDTYVIKTAEQLAWFRDMVNGNDTQTRAATPETFAGKTVMLGADIDLSGQEWEPIGYYPDGNGAMAPFKGVFDGKGYTIKNFKISQKHNDSRGAALFGVVGSATIRNLNISNANIIYPGSDDFYAAGVAGYGYSTTFENITVSDSFIEGNNKIGGIYGHTDNYESNPVIITNCHVSNCTLRSDNEDDGGLVGGLVGVVQNEGHNKISKSSVKNCTIFGHNKNSEGKRSNGEFVANIIGNDKIILEITDCEISGNTFTQAENVTYVSPYGPLVGGNRNEGKGKVIIDGLEIIANGVGINAAGEYRIVSTDGLRSFRNMVNSKALTTEGKTFVLDTDIDLNDEEWVPIGTNGSHFKGTFDGNGKTISNFKITRTNDGAQAALFGTVSGSPVFKNFTIDGADVVYPGSDDYYAAGLIGTYYGHLTITGVTVQNSEISGNNKVAGLVAHDGSSSSLLIDDCHVTGCTISTLNQGDGGNVGGLIGLFAGGGTSANPKDGQHYIKNSSVKDCTINGINSTNTGKRANGEFVACMTGKDNQILHIENCEISGNTFVDKQKDGSAVTYVSPYGPFVAGNREDDGKGVVMIDGKQMIADGVALGSNGVYLVSNIAGLRWVSGNTLMQTRTKVQLVDDIVLDEDEVFEPISSRHSASTDFILEIDGNDKIIFNLNLQSEGKDIGLFTHLGGDVYDLHFKNVKGKGTGRLGALAGNFAGKIKNCTIEGIELEVAEDRVGSFVGLSFGTEITGCSVTNVIISAGEGHAGGLVGTIGGDAKAETYTGNTIAGIITSVGYSTVGALYGGFGTDGQSTVMTVSDNDVTGCTLVTE